MWAAAQKEIVQRDRYRHPREGNGRASLLEGRPRKPAAKKKRPLRGSGHGDEHASIGERLPAKESQGEEKAAEEAAQGDVERRNLDSGGAAAVADIVPLQMSTPLERATGEE